MFLLVPKRRLRYNLVSAAAGKWHRRAGALPPPERPLGGGALRQHGDALKCCNRLVPLSLPSLRVAYKNHSFDLVFGPCPAELGPETRSNGSGSKYGEERTQN